MIAVRTHSLVLVTDGSTNILNKKATTAYNLDTAYVSRRILGLPSKTVSWGYNQSNSQLEKVSEIDYFYDQGDFSDTSLEQNISSVIKHEPAYGASFTVGRGNLTTSTRNDVTGATASVSSQVKYNIAGAPVAQIDPLGRVVKVSYADNFNDTSTTRNTYAYPTKLYDPAGNYSEVKYRFDTGANVWAKSPAPAGNSTGKETTRLFDAIGRVERETVVNSGAYTRFEYPANNVQSKVFTTIVDTNNNGADQADEVYSESWTDGAGRVRKSRTEHPGSVGGWSATLAEYDILGQLKRSTVPTETNSNYEQAGDDATRGWLWNTTEFDWKGRVTRTIPTDSTGSDGKDQLISYEGCGCAGGQVTTVQGELVPRDDDPNQTARRTQKVYQDILGRTFKTEVLNWTGAVYTTTVQTFNGRDQVTKTRQYAGDTNSTSFQDVTMTYDGHGRLKTSHRPEQQHHDRSAAYTVYNYNADDSVSDVTDARGVIKSLSYNSRGLLSLVHYTLPTGANPTLLPLSPDSSFEYDALGNRTLMTAGSGNVVYEYDSLSRITAETRQFTESMQGAPISANKYKLEYGYSLAGALLSYKDPFGTRIEYAQDKSGRLSAVNGSGTGGNRNYAANPQYRAWGALKHLEYGNGTKLDITNFNNRLQGTAFESRDSTNNPIIKKQYQFYADGNLKFSQDQLDPKFDRSFEYDHLSRLVRARTGAEARGQTDAANIPYNQSYSYSAFSQVTSTQARNYTAPLDTTTHPFLNDREDWNPVSQSNWNDEENYPKYADGSTRWHAYNSAGQLDYIDSDVGADGLIRQEFSYDGSGFLVKEVGTERYGTNAPTALKWYQIRSTVLGGEVITELGNSGEKQTTYVHAAGSVIASENGWIGWSHKDPGMNTVRSTDASGNLITAAEGDEFGKLEFDPQGNNVGFTDWWALSTQGTPDPTSGIEFPAFETIRNGQLVRYNVDGVDVPQSYFGVMTEFAFSGVFGLVERQARSGLSGTRLLRNYVISKNGAKGFPLTDRGIRQAYDYAREETDPLWVTTRIHIETNWALNHALLHLFVLPPPPDDPKFGYLTDEGELIKAIKEIIAYAVSKPECTKAFQAAGATPINDQLSELTIVTENMFREYLYDVHWAGGSDAGNAMRQALKGSPNTADLSWPGLYKDSGRRFLGVTKNGIKGIVGGESEYFSVIIIHSLVHTGGIAGKDDRGIGDYLMGEMPHDLRWLGQKYKDILKYCTKEGGSKLLYGQ